MPPLYQNLNQSSEGHWLRDLLFIILLFGPLFLLGLGSAPLIDPDEGRYAEIPREMIVSGDFITPTLNYVKYFEKPPLLYWLNAASMKLLGQTEFAARLPSALSGLMTILLTYFASRRLFDRKTAWLAALILSTSVGFAVQSRIILTDMMLTLCLSAAMFSFLIATSQTVRNKPLFFRLFFAFCGLAVLTKGLIGVVLPAGIIFWYLLIGRRWQLLKEIPWISGLIIFISVTAPWFILVSQANPEFPHFFFIREHFQRYTSNIHHRTQPFWFFLPILLLTMFPWSFFLPGSLKEAWLRHKKQTVYLLLIIWPLVIISFFSISSSKLIPYILPAFPPLSLMIAQRIANSGRTHRQNMAFSVLPIAVVMISLGTAVATLPLLSWLPPMLHKSGQSGRELAVLLTSPSTTINLHNTLPIGAFLIILGALLFWTIRKRTSTMVVALLSCMAILLEVLIAFSFSHYAAERLSSRNIAMAALKHSDSKTIIAQSGPRQGMNFYTGRRLITVGDFDELAFGSTMGDQHKWFLNQNEFILLWRSEQHVLFVMPKHELKRYDLALQTEIPRTLADNGSLVLVSNR